MEITEYFKIGELSKKSGISIETLRFYENKGLLPTQGRTASGYRLYNQHSFRRIQFIQHTKELGFSLQEIKELLALQQSQGDDCHDVRQQVLEKLAEVEQKIKQLNQVRDSLIQLSTSCNGLDPVSQCPILNHFENCHQGCHHD